MIDSYELTPVELDENNLGWNLLEQGSYYKTDHHQVFLYFLNSPGTTHYELGGMDGVIFTLICHGPTGTVIFEKKFHGMAVAEKRKLCHMIKISPRHMGQSRRVKLSHALENYLGLEPEKLATRLPSKK